MRKFRMSLRILCVILSHFLITIPFYAQKNKLSIYTDIGISNIDYPGKGKNPNFVLEYELGITFEREISKIINLGTGLMFQKSGYLEKNGYYFEDIPIDVGIKDYRLICPCFIFLFLNKEIPLSLIIGIENSFEISKKLINSSKSYLELGKSNIYNINADIGLRWTPIKILSLGLIYKRGLNGLYRNVHGFNLNIIALTINWNIYNF